MAASPPLTDENSQTEPYSPSTVCPSDFKYSTNQDCEAVGDISAPQKRTWRAWMGVRKIAQVEDIEKTATRQLEKCPNGYPRLAAFLSSEQNFSIYRGFGYLHSRVLLSLQDQIVALERELDAKDEIDVNNGMSRRLQSRARDEHDSRRDGDDRPRETILSDVRKKLVEYDELLVRARDLVSFQRPSERDYSSVRNWFRYAAPLVEKEQAFIRHKEDILTLNNRREWCGFDGFVESMLLKLDCRLVKWLFLTQELRDKTQYKNVHYYARSRVEKLVGLIITSTIFILLVLPVIAMYNLTTIGAKQSTFSAIGVLVVFTLLFSAAMSLLTKAQRHELFAASAAYCAVLVVFISNFSN